MFEIHAIDSWVADDWYGRKVLPFDSGSVDNVAAIGELIAGSVDNVAAVGELIAGAGGGGVGVVVGTTRAVLTSIDSTGSVGRLVLSGFPIDTRVYANKPPQQMQTTTITVIGRSISFPIHPPGLSHRWYP
jgi:hypothetical protein